MVLATLKPAILPTALDILQHDWEVDPSPEGALARAIAIDTEDYASQNKLRLLRICKILCRPSLPWELAVLVAAQLPTQTLTFDLLG